MQSNNISIADILRELKNINDLPAERYEKLAKLALEKLTLQDELNDNTTLENKSLLYILNHLRNSITTTEQEYVRYMQHALCKLESEV